MTQELRLLAPAKINLHLRVGSPTADGFHPLVSWMCTVGLFDTLTLRQLDTRNVPRSRGEGPGRTQSLHGCEGGDAPGSAGAVAAPVPSPVLCLIELTCDDPNLRCDGSNLIVQAGVVMSETLLQGPGVGRVAASLAKRIPMGGGLGGGSSDGARMLLGLNQLWAGGLNRTAVAALSAKLGSDMPFFCHGVSSVCTGRGEVVVATPRPTPRWVLLLLPEIHMPTPAVYKRFDQLVLGDSATIDQQPNWVKWSQLPAEQLMALLVNDLEAPAFSLRPDLLECKNLMEELLGRRALMSGSGSSLFTLYDEQAEAEVAEKYITARMNQRGQKVRASAVELAPTFTDDLIAR